MIARTARQFPFIAALVVVLALAPIALAAKGGGGKPGGGGSSTGGGGTITLNPLVTDNNGNGLPNYGDVVNFTVSTTSTTVPYVNLQCSQNGAVVLNSWQGYFVGSLNWPNTNFGLASGAWQGGAATCTAWVDMYNKNGSWTKLASTSFSVGA